MAKVGISAMRIRRKAFAMEASIPTREKTASRGLFLWNCTWNFWECNVQHEFKVWKMRAIYLGEFLKGPGMVFTGKMTRKISGRDICDCLDIDTNDLLGLAI